MPRVSVNLTFLLGALACTACGPSPRPVPPLPPRDDEVHQLPDPPRVAWRNDLGSGLLSTLTARGPALFATTTNRTVVALAQDNGRRYWLQRFAGAVNTGALVANNRVYFATADLKGEAVALDVARGRRVWSRRVGAVRLSPLLAEQHVLFATDSGQLFALHITDGRVVWRTDVSGAFAVAPVAWRDQLLTASAADTVYAIALADGSIRQRARIASTPSAPGLLLADTLILPLQNGAVVGLDANSLRVLFEHKLDAPALAPPRRVESAVYVLSRNAVLWRLTGGSVEKVVDLDGAARASLAVVGKLLVVGLLDGRLIALDAAGRRLWEQQLPRSVVAPATPSGTALFVPMINGEVWKLER
ncbi:MAG: PQQ-binding-like beta-propeller repeat protein [Longimicrobiales bacterium]